MSRKHALVNVSWRSLPPALTYPITNKFTTTGYREIDGPEGIFSVHLEVTSGEAGPGRVQTAKLSALAEAMEARLPEPGTRFLLTTGATVVADCIAR